jgi:aldehyde:ferredoxin oxidoreductase
MGERIINVERALNVQAGLTPQDDALPARMLTEPMPDGIAKGEVVRLQPMLDRYYQLRGWDRVTGRPGDEKLKELGLAEVIDRLRG